MLRWAEDDVQGFRARYEGAKVFPAHALFDKMRKPLEAPRGSPRERQAPERQVQAVKPKVEAIKWYIARVSPKN